MGILDFIFRILVLIVFLFIGVGAICMKWDTRKLEEENAKLKEDLKKARGRKIRREYKKLSNIGGEK